MSKYDKETKFYWLQLKEDFFEDDSIEWLEEQQPNGRDYAYFYLKLCLKSLKSNGILIRQVGDILIPYDNKKLAELTKMDFDTVTVAMELLKKIGLVKILENGEIYVTQLENLIGSVSKGALKKQQQRLIKNSENQLGWTNVCQMSTKDKDKVKDKDKNKDKVEVDIYSIIEQNFGRTLNPIEYETITNWNKYNFPLEMLKYATTKAVLKNIYNISYISKILYEWDKNNIRTLAQAQEEDKKFTDKPKRTYKTRQEKEEEAINKFLSEDD